jgi:hypothetical protein
MYYLYGIKRDASRRLVAMFGSEQQLLAYVRWATLEGRGDRRGKFEQGSALAMRGRCRPHRLRKTIRKRSPTIPPHRCFRPLREAGSWRIGASHWGYSPLTY